MSFIFWALALILLFFGYVGCFVHKFPGHILAFLSLLVFKFCLDMEFITYGNLGICFLAVILCMILSKYIPVVASKVSEFGKAGSRGAVVGSLLGLLVILSSMSPDSSTAFVLAMIVVGMLVLPYVFATLFELIVRKDFVQAANAGLGALVTFLMSTMLKLLVCGFCTYMAFFAERL